MLLNSLVEYFLETNSSQAVDILSSVREPHDKVRTLNRAYAGFVSQTLFVMRMIYISSYDMTINDKNSLL